MKGNKFQKKQKNSSKNWRMSVQTEKAHKPPSIIHGGEKGGGAMKMYHYEISKYWEKKGLKNFQMGKNDHWEGKGIIMALDFSTATLGSRWLGGNIFKMQRENYFQPRILSLAKMSIKHERRLKLDKVSKNSPPVHSFSESCRTNVPWQN